MVINKYKFNFNEENYITGFCAVLDDDYDFVGQMALYPEACEGWCKLIDGNIVIDEVKKAEIIAKREEEAKKPTTQDVLEAQVTYTALMTDTLLPE